MGVDVNLYAEADPSPERLMAANETFKTRCSVADEYEVDGDVKWHALAYEDHEWYDRPRVVANVTQRYYGEGYERGDWPSIYGVIRLLQALFPEAKVYYGGDTTDDGEECTAERLEEIWQHYVGHEGNAYRERNRAWNARHATLAAADDEASGSAL